MSWIPETFFAEGLSFPEDSEGPCSFGLRECTCAVCKKRFSRTAKHAWKLNGRKKTLYFCSYSCMRAVEKVEQEKARIQREEAYKKDMALLAAEEERHEMAVRRKLNAEERREHEAALRRLKYMEEHPNCYTHAPTV